VTQARVSSFYKTMDDLGLEVPDAYVKEAGYRNTKDTYRATCEVLELDNPPTCIFYPDDFASFGGINAINERGLRIPEDVSVVGYDGIRVGRHIQPKLTTLRQDTDTIGVRAAEALIHMIEQPKTTLIEQIVVAGTLYEGKTVKQL